MPDSKKTKGQLIKEINDLRQQLKELQATERKLVRTEKALYESETEYQSLFESMKEGIIVSGPNGRILSANPAAATLLGYNKPSELIDKLMVQFYDNPESRKELFDELLKKGYVDEFETVFIKKDGTQAYGLASITLHKDEQGNIMRVDGIFRDITERKRMEQALFESEQKFRVLAEQALQGIVLAKAFPPQLIFANSAIAKIMGYTLIELLSLSSDEIIKLVHPDDQAVVFRIYKNLLKGQTALTPKELRAIRKDGSICWVEVLTSRIEYGGEPILYTAIVDITERKKAEEDQERLTSQLFQAQKMEALGRLAGGIAHDFNNLLTIVQGHVDLAATRDSVPNEIKNDLQQIKLTADSMSALTRQLLFFGRRQKLDLKVVNVTELVEKMVKMLAPIIDEKITLHTELKNHIWPIKADVISIEQVVMNLILNARDAMPDGGDLVISTRNIVLDENESQPVPDACPGDFVRLIVRDSGTGMNQETLQRIFDPFFTTKEFDQGTGLGLSIVYGILKQHNGWINISSKPDEGSTFYVYLPAVREEKTRQQSLAPVSLQSLQGKGQKILYIEDETGVRTTTEIALNRNGFQVTSVKNAKQALDLFEKENGNFDLAFSDLVLPDLNGLELIDKLQTRKPSLKVLLSSGFVNDRRFWPIIEQKGYKMLHKPFALIDLLQALNCAFYSRDAK